MRVDIPWRERTVQIEYAWLGVSAFDGTCDTANSAATIVFLHEGLGSLAMWKDFPQQLCAAAQCKGLVYSRPGYGQSSPRGQHEVWGNDFMHQQAHEVLPALLAALHLTAPVCLVGHSDGASIALLYAAQFPSKVTSMVVIAPHLFVEDVCVQSIARVGQAYENTPLRAKLAQYHSDPDATFWGWHNVWLSPQFKYWNIEAALKTITCPVMAVQGLDDEYGTLSQIRNIRQQLPHAQLLEIPECGHSPHRDQTGKLIAGVTAFFSKHSTH